MDKTLEKDLVDRIYKLERDVAVLKRIQEVTGEKSIHDEFHKNSWKEKVI